MRKLLVAGFWLLALVTSPAFAKPKVVASFSIIGDITKEVAGEHIEITNLVGNNGDAHEYEPTPADAKIISEADLVLINGLGFEGWMERLIKSSGYKGKVVTVSSGIKYIKSDDGHEHSHEHDHNHDGNIDPHAWQDLSNGKIYVENIKKALIEIDRNHMEEYSKNAIVYTKKLSELDNWIKNEFAKIPPEKRNVISTHDAFQYFAKAYSINFISALGVSTEAQPSAADVARLIDQIRAQKVSTVFVENMTDSRLMKQLEKDAGAHIGGTLYSDSLSEQNGPAATYIDMFKHNYQELLKAIKYNKIN